jgi:hypothetical protein
MNNVFAFFSTAHIGNWEQLLLASCETAKVADHSNTIKSFENLKNEKNSQKDCARSKMFNQSNNQSIILNTLTLSCRTILFD